MLFRPEAIEAKRRRLWGEVHLSQPPSLTAWVLVGAVICGIVIVVLATAQFTRKESVVGWVSPESGVVTIRPTGTGRVTRVLVREGQQVSPGTPLVEFATDLRPTGEAALSTLQLTQSRRVEASILERRQAVNRQADAERARIYEQRQTLHRQLALLNAQLVDQIEVAKLASAEASRLAELSAQGYAPRVEADRRRRALLAERLAQSDLEARIAEFEGRISDLATQAAATEADAIERLAQLDAEAAGVAQRAAELRTSNGYVITSPIHGRVSALQVTAGVTPTPDHALMTIAEDGGQLEGHLLVPSRAIGFVSPGMPARLQVDAYPFQRFGVVMGRVVSVSSTALDPRDARVPVDLRETAYLVRVQIPAPYVEAYGQKRRLKAGMGLKADLAIDRKYIWQQLFDPIIAATR